MDRRWAVLGCLAATLFLRPALAGDGWIPPSASANPEGRWSAPAQACDNDLVTYAADGSNRAGWGAWLELEWRTPVFSDRLRVAADFGSGIVDQVDIDVKPKGAAA